MKNEIPHIRFKSKYPEIAGIEIIRINDIIKRKDYLKPSPEKPHKVEFYKLIFFTCGKTEHLIDFVWHKAEKNTLFYLSKGNINAWKFNPDIKGFVILFTEEYFKKQLNNIPQDTVIRLFTSHLFSPKIQIPDTSNIPDYIQFLFDEFHQLNRNVNKTNIVDSLFTIVFSKIEELKKQQTLHLKDSEKLTLFYSFQKLLRGDYPESRNAAHYAKKLNITYKHLNVVCKEVLNTTAKQFIDEFVILEAKRKLINSDIKSTELAYSMGFEESSNFSKYFKKHTGFTPNQFKKLHI